MFCHSSKRNVSFDCCWLLRQFKLNRVAGSVVLRCPSVANGSLQVVSHSTYLTSNGGRSLSAAPAAEAAPLNLTSAPSRSSHARTDCAECTRHLPPAKGRLLSFVNIQLLWLRLATLVALWSGADHSDHQLHQLIIIAITTSSLLVVSSHTASIAPRSIAAFATSRSFQSWGVDRTSTTASVTSSTRRWE